MKSTGITRAVDELGRIVIPIELRRALELERGDACEIFIEGENIILRKYVPGCVFCGEIQGVEPHLGKKRMSCM